MADPEAHPSSSLAQRPSPLSIVTDNDGGHRTSATQSRKLSDASSDNSPLHSALDSTAALILAHDEDDEDEDRDDERPLNMDFSTDEDNDSDDLDDGLSPLYQINGKLSIPPLPPFTIFIYLLSPYLKLGALLLPYYQLPLKFGLSSVLVSAVLAVVARHLLYLLARYLRKADFEEVVSSAFVSSKKKGKRGERRRGFIKFLVRLGTAALRVLLTVMYLRECVQFILPLFSLQSHQLPTEVALISITVLIALLLSYPRSLASRVVIYATYLSICAYLLWLVSITYLYTQGTLPINTERFSSQNIWDGLVATAFIFTSSNTLPLYASTKGTIQPLLFEASTSLSIPASGASPSTGNPTKSRKDGRLKQPLYRSFKFLSLMSIAVALCLVLPPVGFAAFPNSTPKTPPTVVTYGGTDVDFAGVKASVGHVDQLPDWKFPYPPGESTPATRIQTYIMPMLASLALLFGTPQLLITIPIFPPGSFNWLRKSASQRHTSRPEVWSKLVVLFKKSAVGISLLALALISLYLDLSDALKSSTMVLSILATYYIPPVLHVLSHTFKSPLSIILPSTYFSYSSAPTPVASSRPSTTLPGPSSNASLGDANTFNSSTDNPTQTPTTTARAPPPLLSLSRHRHTQSQREHDDLLQRKERALQKKQMRRRIVWDILAWGISLGGIVILVLGPRLLGD